MKAVHVILGAPKESDIMPLIQSEGLVIGVDRGALLAIEEEIELDIALGDFDSIETAEKLKVRQYAKEICTFPTDKDDTDAELALLYIIDTAEVDTIYLYNWYGGRVDHLHSLLMLVLQKRFLPLVSKIKFVSEKNNISYYLPGNYTLSKIEHMEYLSFIVMTTVRELTLKNVKYPLVEADIDTPSALISNEFLNKEAQISFVEGIVAVIQSRD